MYRSEKGDHDVLGYFACWKCERNIGDAMGLEENLFNEMRAVREFAYLGAKVSSGGICEAAMTARTRCGWVRFMECGKLLIGKKFPVELEGLFTRAMFYMEVKDGA